MAIDRILRIREVEEVTGLSRASIYLKVTRKTFPPQVRLTAHTVGWRESDIGKWIASLQPIGEDEAADDEAA